MASTVYKVSVEFKHINIYYMRLQFTLALGSTKNPTKQVMRALSWGYGQGTKLTTYTYLVLRFNSQWGGLYLHFTTCLHGVHRDHFAFPLFFALQRVLTIMEYNIPNAFKFATKHHIGKVQDVSDS